MTESQHRKTKPALFIGASLFAAMLVISGCSAGDKDITNKRFEGDKQTVCLDGVTYYLLSWGYMSVKLDRNSKVVPCD